MYRTQLTGFLLVLLTLVSASAMGAETGAQAAGQELKTSGAENEAPDKPRVPRFSIEGDLAGELSVMTTRYEDTFAAIGNQNSLGYLELVKANPGVDP